MGAIQTRHTARPEIGHIRGHPFGYAVVTQRFHRRLGFDQRRTFLSHPGSFHFHFPHGLRGSGVGARNGCLAASGAHYAGFRLSSGSIYVADLNRETLKRPAYNAKPIKTG